MLNLKAALADAKARSSLALATALQHEIDNYHRVGGNTVKAPAQASSTQDRKTLAKLTRGAVTLEQDFLKQSRIIQQQRDNLQTQVELKREAQNAFFEALKAEFDARANAQEALFDQFMQDTQVEAERLDDVQHNLDKDYRRQMANHESAQANVSLKLTQERAPGCQRETVQPFPSDWPAVSYSPMSTPPSPPSPPPSPSLPCASKPLSRAGSEPSRRAR